jgi:hypothetical protein
MPCQKEKEKEKEKKSVGFRITQQGWMTCFISVRPMRMIADEQMNTCMRRRIHVI